MKQGLELHSVSVTYPGSPEPAVRDVTMSVHSGEVLGLLGPSGCGKSTVLGTIAGIVPTSAGTITFGGIDVTREAIHKRSFGLVFQDGLLFPHRTVEGNVAFGLEMARLEKNKRQERVRQVLDIVGLESFAKRRVSELSGGQRQRVALARALAPQPRLLMLDEPFASLDTDLRASLATSVRSILRDTGTTAILVTHDPAEAAVVCDRVVRMDKGRLI